MMLNFNTDQCVLIENREQYESIYHHMRSANTYSSLSEWESVYGKITKDDFPFYLQWSESVTRGRSIGRISEPKNTWTKKPLEILTFDLATN